jgi:hypothetical protein
MGLGGIRHGLDSNLGALRRDRAPSTFHYNYLFFEKMARSLSSLSL